MLTSLALVGCGQADYDSKRQAAIMEQMLPPGLADAPAKVNLPKWGVRNPHVHVRSKDGKVEIYSDDTGWSGHTINVYYVPAANVEYYNGDYAVHSTYALQRVATAHLRKNGSWLATWNLKGHELPDIFYLLVRTDVGQVTVEKMKADGQKVTVTGAGNPVA
jgi:hypothetical protein